MKNILFVCMGNICRSPLAEGVFRAASRQSGDHFVIDSAGTSGYHAGEPADPRACRVARLRGTPVDDLRARQVVKDDFRRFDLLLAADRENLRFLQTMRPADGSAAELGLLLEWAGCGAGAEVPDPYYGDESDFERVYELLLEATATLLPKLLELRSRKQQA